MFGYVGVSSAKPLKKNALLGTSKTARVIDFGVSTRIEKRGSKKTKKDFSLDRFRAFDKNPVFAPLQATESPV